LSQLASSEDETYTRFPSQLCEIMLTCLPVTFSYVCTGFAGSDRSKYRVFPSMNVLTHRPLPSALMLMSTGSGIFDGSPMSATACACHWPDASCLTSHSFEVSAEAVTAQLSPCLSDQRISSGAPGTASTFDGFMAFRSHTTIGLPKCFIASGSLMRSPRSRR